MQIDVYNPDNYLRGIPHAQFAWLRENSPVHWQEHPDGGGYWAISKHADVLQVSRDNKTFSAQQGFVMVDDLEPDTEYRYSIETAHSDYNSGERTFHTLPIRPSKYRVIAMGDVRSHPERQRSMLIVVARSLVSIQFPH